MQRIDECWLILGFHSGDNNGERGDSYEGIAAFQNPIDGSWMPMIAADKDRLNQLVELAKEMIKDTGQEMRVSHYTNRVDLGSVMEL